MVVGAGGGTPGGATVGGASIGFGRSGTFGRFGRFGRPTPGLEDACDVWDVWDVCCGNIMPSLVWCTVKLISSASPGSLISASDWIPPPSP